MQTKEKLELQLRRLQRHYEKSAKSYDQISLLDLAHSLRVWVEIRGNTGVDFPAFEDGKLFRTSSPSKQLLAKFRDDPYVISYMPGGISTWANKGNTLRVPPSLKADSIYVGGRIRRLPEGGLQLGRFFVAGANVKKLNGKLLEAETIKRCGFSGWLAGDAVRLNYWSSKNRLVNVQLSREILIKRVANTLEASHSSLSSTKKNTQPNMFDEPVHYLMDFGWGGLPLPYFVLLKCAQDLIEVSRTIMDLDIQV